MSHIPASAMPHASAHHEDNAAGSQQPSPPNNDAAENTGTVAQVTEQAQQAASTAAEAVKSAASSASDTAGNAAAATGEAVNKAATATTDAAKSVAGKVGGLPTYAKLLGLAALVGGIAAAVAVPLLQEPEQTGRAKRKKSGKKA
jgi:hypothetical protein